MAKLLLKSLDMKLKLLLLLLFAQSAFAITYFEGGINTPSLINGNVTLNGTSILLPSGSVGAPSLSFSGDTDTGFYRLTDNSLALTLGGVKGLEVTNIGSSLVNFGFGTGASGTSTAPVIFDRSINNVVTWQFGNGSTGASSVSSFLIYNGTGSNYLQLENWANQTSNTYLGGGSVITSSPNQTQLIIASEGGSSFIGFPVGGKTLATERMRLSTSSLALKTGLSLSMTGSTSGTLTHSVPTTVTSYGLTWPSTQGGSNTVLTNNGSGSLSWTSISGGPAAYRSVTTTDSPTTSDEILALSGASFTVTLPTAVGNTGKRFTLFHNGTNLTQVYTLATTSGQTIGGVASGSYALYTKGERLIIISDGSNWQILEHETNTGWIDAGTNTITATTTNPTKASGITVDKIYWRRVGSNAEIRIEYAQSNTTSANSGSGDYLFAIPSNMTIDTSTITTFTTVIGAGGAASITNGNGGGQWRVVNTNNSLAAIVYDTTKIRFYYINPNGGGMIDSSNGFQSASWSLGAAFSVPISGWQP
jgi:hypothetical protein